MHFAHTRLFTKRYNASTKLNIPPNVIRAPNNVIRALSIENKIGHDIFKLTYKFCRRCKQMNSMMKKAITICLSLCLILAMTLTVEAKYVPKKWNCPRCNKTCTSYGYDPHYGGVTQTQNAGNYCPVCDKIVPKGEVHMYMWDYDRYYFLCDGSRCQKLNFQDRVFTHDFKLPVSEHYTNGIRDF